MPSTLSMKIKLGASAFYFWMIAAILMGIDLSFVRPIPEYVGYFGTMPNTLASGVMGVLFLVGGTVGLSGHLTHHELMERLGLILVAMAFLFNSLGRFLWIGFHYANPATVPHPPSITNLQPMTLIAYAFLFLASGAGILFMSTREKFILDRMGGK